MSTNKQALRGQSVEGSFYLAECGYCAQVMPSSKLRVLNSPDGEAECYCPHCNAEDSEIFDLGIAGSEVITAWNYQQKRIEALLDELEAKEKRIAELSVSHSKLHEGMAAIYNAICADGASTSLSAILTFVKRAFEESKAAAGITVKGE